MTWKRIATAAVLVPLVVGLVLWGSTAWVALGMALVILLALFEYFALGDAIGHRAYRFWTAACALLLVYFQWLPSFMPSDHLGDWSVLERRYQHVWLFMRRPPGIPETFFIFVLGIAALTLATKRPVVESLPAAGISSSGFLLVAFPLSFAIRLHGIGVDGPKLLLFALVITWVGDTAAYFVGRAIGKHALAPVLSPHKSWEGAIASMFGALLVAVLFTRFLTVTPLHLLVMAAAGNVAGQAGDLLESAYKRSAGVKDSGSLLPGHGGVLDRIDALILTIPVVWYYWIWIYSPNR